jgi:glutathione synthase/RimK-type ligase-like ATP-grasp enzyme
MKNKIFVICLKHDENLLSLYQEAYYLDYEVIPLYINRLENVIKSLDNIITINDHVMVLHTNFGSDVVHHLAQNIKCKRFLNKLAFNHILIGNKQYQQEQVAILNPSIVIKTYNKKTINQSISMPVIAKPTDGSCGKGIVLLSDIESVLKTPDNYIFQPFIKNDGDWRVIVIGGKSVSAIKRLGNTNKVTNNLATGSFALKENDPQILESIYKVAESAANSLNFDYVGIDVIKDINTGQYYFLESNERPTFETSQILTGVNIAQKIILELTK